MATRTIHQLVSDLTGKEIAKGDGETVTFSLDGVDYEIDVTTKEADKVRGAFQDYIAAGRKVGRTSSAKRLSNGRSAGSGRSSEELQQIREWAKSNGYEVADRGRVKAEVIEAYEAAN